MDNQELRREQIRRKKRREMIKRQKRNRLIFLVILLVIIFSIIRKGVRFVADRGSNYGGGTVVQWYWNQMNHKKETLKSHNSIISLYKEDGSNILREKVSRFGGILAENSNHIDWAEEYAYETKKIRDIILGNTAYDGEKLVFLTFDDGPNNVITPQILDVLQKNQAYGTFFVVGKNITSKHEDVLRRELLEGHGIAMHSLTHDYTKLYPKRVGNIKQIGYEAEKSQELLRGVFGENFTSGVWRYPGGILSWDGLGEESNAAIQKAGAEWIDWNCLTGDAQPKSSRPTTPEEIVEFLDMSLSRARHPEVAVVLMHDAVNKQLTVDSLEEVIQYFKDKDYKFGILK